MSAPREVLPTNVTPLHYELEFEPDFETFKFAGVANIDLKINDPSIDVLTLNSQEIEYHSVRLNDVKATEVKLDEEAQRVDFVFPSGTVAACNGNAKLYTTFTGILNDQMAGFYRAKYTDKATGELRYMATTQMESTDARRAFPCFDEPGLKATFDITLISKDTSLTHLSNMDVKEESIVDGKKVTRFNTTPKMSTYLVAFIVADLRYVECNDFRIPIRVYATPGDEHLGQYAADLTAKTLEFFEKTFGIEYPLPKMDSVAVHEFSAGAMENWGLVTYRVIDILLDEKNASLGRIQRVASVVHHELAHQWFGNLVTMDWWEGLWLNEGFATWMSWYACNHFQPTWKVWDQYVADNLQRALALDCLRSSHPIEVPVQSAGQIAQIFDAISYAKGSSLLRMIANWLGEDVMIKGVSNYLNKFKYGNAKTEDLWNALSEASGKDVTKVMSTWTKKIGYPVVTVIEDGNKVTFVQNRYLSTGDVQPEEDTTVYPVFLSVKTKDGVDKNMILDEKTKTFELKDTEFYKVNADQAGVYVTLYPNKRWEAFGKQRQLLSVEDRTGLIADAKNLAASGYTTTINLLNLLSNWKDEDNFVVWEQIATSLVAMRRAWVFESEEVEEGLKAFMRNLVADKVEKLNWTFPESESYNERRLKVALFGIACSAGVESVTKAAVEMFQKYVAGDKTAIPPLIKQSVFNAVGRKGGVENYEKLLDIFKNSDNTEEKLGAIRSLGCFKEPELIKRTIGYLLDGTILKQDVYYPMVALTGRKEGILALWEWIQSNFATIIKEHQPGSPVLKHIMNICTSSFTTFAKVDEIKAFFADKPTEGFDMSLAQALDSVKTKAAWVKRDSAEVKKYLKENKFMD